LKGRLRFGGKFVTVLCFLALVAGCLYGCSSSSVPTVTDSGSKVTKLTTNASGEATYGSDTISLVNESGEPVEAEVTVTEDQEKLLVEVDSKEYIYSAVNAQTGSDIVVFTQKADKYENPVASGDLDTECVPFTEDIVGSTGESTGLTKMGLLKPTPKNLQSSDGRAKVTISSMNLQKDVTAALTPYKAYPYIPYFDEVGFHIGYPDAEVLAGAAVNLADDMGNPTTSEDVCLSGKMSFATINMLSWYSQQEVQQFITSGSVVLVVLKDKRWQRVDADISYMEQTSEIEVENAAANLRLYPFLFVKAGDSDTFKLTGTVYEHPEYDNYDEQLYSETYPAVSGAKLTLDLPLVLDTLKVDNEANTITIGKTGDSYSYEWKAKAFTGDATDFNPEAVDWSTNLFKDSGSATDTSIFTLDQEKKTALSEDGKYLLRVEVIGNNGYFEAQNGLVIKSGDSYTLKMNPLAPVVKTTTSDDQGVYTLSGLSASLLTFYSLAVEKSGYVSYLTKLYGEIVDGILKIDVWLDKSDGSLPPEVASYEFDEENKMLTVKFNQDMKDYYYYTTGDYDAAESYWSAPDTFVMTFNSWTAGGQITLHKDDFISTYGTPMAEDKVINFPSSAENTFSDATFSGNYTTVGFSSLPDGSESDAWLVDIVSNGDGTGADSSAEISNSSYNGIVVEQQEETFIYKVFADGTLELGAGSNEMGSGLGGMQKMGRAFVYAGASDVIFGVRSSPNGNYTNASVNGSWLSGSLAWEQGSILTWGETFVADGQGTMTGEEQEEVTYSVDSTGRMEIVGTNVDAVCQLNEAADLALCFNQLTEFHPEIAVLMKSGTQQNYTNASLQGTWSTAWFRSDDLGGVSANYPGHGTYVFDGAGNVEYSYTVYLEEGVTEDYSDTGTYSVEPDGSFIVDGDTIMCRLNHGATAFGCVPNNEMSTNMLSLGVKRLD
jgi:hypothetical protein